MRYCKTRHINKLWSNNLFMFFFFLFFKLYVVWLFGYGFKQELTPLYNQSRLVCYSNTNLPTSINVRYWRWRRQESEMLDKIHIDWFHHFLQHFHISVAQCDDALLKRRYWLSSDPIAGPFSYFSSNQGCFEKSCVDKKSRLWFKLFNSIQFKQFFFIVSTIVFDRKIKEVEW